MSPRAATIERAWRVFPEIVRLAREPRYTVRMPLGPGQARDFRLERFEAREGFSIDEDTGQLIVSDDPDELSYYWYGRNGRDHLALTVVRGRVEGRVYTPAQRHTLSAWGREHHYQRMDMGLLNRGVCRHREVLARLESMAPERPESADDEAAVSKRLAVAAARRDRAAAQARRSPDPRAGLALAKYAVHIDLLFYFTDVLAEAIDDDSDPDWNYTPGNIAIAEALLGPRIQAYLDELNQSLQNSGGLTHIRFWRRGAAVRLLDADGEPYMEDSAGADPFQRFAGHLLTLARYENDWILGFPAPPGPRRADHDADLAILLVWDMGDPAASPPFPMFGVAFMQRAGCGSYGGTQCGVGPGLGAGEFGLFAYGVVSAAPQTANFTFSHELGHLLGADHDLPTALVPPPPSFAHSFGHKTATVRDIMADPACGNWLSDTCPRAQQFSSPEVHFIGTSIPAGTAGGRACPAPVGCPYTSFNALTIRKNAQGHANIYPVGSAAEPEIFWDGLEFFCEPPLCPVW